MADRYVETKTTSYGQRIAGSFQALLIGIVLFVVSFGVLYWNEGRFDLSIIAKKSEVLSPTEVNSSLDDKLVSVTSNVITADKIGDGLYLKPDKYIAVKRIVEMYAWEQNSSSSTEDHYGGSQTTTTEYTYQKTWKSVNFVSDESTFKVPEGHENPEPTMRDTSSRSNSASIGVYSLNMNAIELPSLSYLSLNNQNVSISGKVSIVDGRYIYVPQKNSVYDNPEVGDIRISYKVLPSGTLATVFGKLSGKTLVQYQDSKNHTLYHLLQGDREAGIDALHSQYVTWLWVWRGLGFFFMWLGLMMMFGFLGVIASVIPALGQFVGGSVQAVAFIIAFALSLVTILVSIIFHNPYLLAAVMITSLYLIFRKSKTKKKKK